MFEAHEGEYRFRFGRVVELHILEPDAIGALGIIEVTLVVVIDGGDIGSEQQAFERPAPDRHFVALDRSHDVFRSIEVVVRLTRRQLRLRLASMAQDTGKNDRHRQTNSETDGECRQA